MRIHPASWAFAEYPLHCAATRQNEAGITLLLGKGDVPRNGLPGYARRRYFTQRPKPLQCSKFRDRQGVIESTEGNGLHTIRPFVPYYHWPLMHDLNGENYEHPRKQEQVVPLAQLPYFQPLLGVICLSASVIISVQPSRKAIYRRTSHGLYDPLSCYQELDVQLGIYYILDLY